MLNIRHQSVNVDRLELIKVLKSNLETHIAEYIEAVKDYESCVRKFSDELRDRIEKGDYSKVSFTQSKPSNHEKEFKDIIEMLEVSVDETIQLDREAFKAYYRNEWPWSGNFSSLSASLKSIASGMSASIV